MSALKTRLDEVGWALADRGRDRGAQLLRARDIAQTELGHEATDPVTSDVAALASQLAPDLAHTVDREVALVHPLDLGLQLGVTTGPGRGWS